MDDWSKAQPPYDVTKFVPYDFMFDVEFTDVEVLLPVNSYNWVDNSSKTKRNGLKKYCELLRLVYVFGFIYKKKSIHKYNQNQILSFKKNQILLEFTLRS